MTQADDCKLCLSGIGELKGQFLLLNGSMMKIFYALIALAAASVGTKYIGTPWYIELSMYSAIFSAVFVLLISIWKWRCLNVWEKWIRVSFVLGVAYAFCLRVYHYNTDTDFTKIEGMVKTLLETVMAVGFILLAWRRDGNRQHDQRRHDDKMRS